MWSVTGPMRPGQLASPSTAPTRAPAWPSSNARSTSSSARISARTSVSSLAALVELACGGSRARARACRRRSRRARSPCACAIEARFELVDAVATRRRASAQAPSAGSVTASSRSASSSSSSVKRGERLLERRRARRGRRRSPCGRGVISALTRDERRPRPRGAPSGGLGLAAQLAEAASRAPCSCASVSARSSVELLELRAARAPGASRLWWIFARSSREPLDEVLALLLEQQQSGVEALEHRLQAAALLGEVADEQPLLLEQRLELLELALLLGETVARELDLGVLLALALARRRPTRPAARAGRRRRARPRARAARAASAAYSRGLGRLALRAGAAGGRPRRGRRGRARGARPWP